MGAGSTGGFRSASDLDPGQPTNGAGRPPLSVVGNGFSESLTRLGPGRDNPARKRPPPPPPTPSPNLKARSHHPSPRCGVPTVTGQGRPCARADAIRIPHAAPDPAAPVPPPPPLPKGMGGPGPARLAPDCRPVMPESQSNRVRVASAHDPVQVLPSGRALLARREGCSIAGPPGGDRTGRAEALISSIMMAANPIHDGHPTLCRPKLAPLRRLRMPLLPPPPGRGSGARRRSFRNRNGPARPTAAGRPVCRVSTRRAPGDGARCKNDRESTTEGAVREGCGRGAVSRISS
jgi:hypothetical protein